MNYPPSSGQGATLAGPPSLSAAPNIQTNSIFEGLSPPTSPQPPLAPLGTSSSNNVNPPIQQVPGALHPVQLQPISQLSPTKSPSMASNAPSLEPVGPVRLPDISVTPTGRLPLVTSNIGNNTDDPNAALYGQPPQMNASGDSGSSLNFSPSVGGAESSMENQLAAYGYITTDRIVTKSQTGEVEGRYLKTINSRGQTVYVEPDIDGWVAFQDTDMTIYETNKASKIPLSVRVGTLECAGMDVCGVAFECRGEICTLTRNEGTMDPVEIVLHTFNEPDAKSVIEEGSLIAYPVVRMGEIIADNARVVDNVDKAVARIRNTAYQFCHENMRSTQEQCERMRVQFAELKDGINGAFNNLGKSIRELEGYRTQFDINPGTDADEVLKMRKIAFNLRRRHDMMVDLLTTCSAMSAYGDQIRELTEKFEETAEHVKVVYSTVGGVYEE